MDMISGYFVVTVHSYFMPFSCNNCLKSLTHLLLRKGCHQFFMWPYVTLIKCCLFCYILAHSYVEGSELLLCGNYIYHQYHDCQDVAYYLCADQVNDVLALPTENRTLTPVLACMDRMIRILQVTAFSVVSSGYGNSDSCTIVVLTMLNTP